MLVEDRIECESQKLFLKGSSFIYLSISLFLLTSHWFLYVARCRRLVSSCKLSSHLNPEQRQPAGTAWCAFKVLPVNSTAEGANYKETLSLRVSALTCLCSLTLFAILDAHLDFAYNWPCKAGFKEDHLYCYRVVYGCDGGGTWSLILEEQCLPSERWPASPWKHLPIHDGRCHSVSAAAIRNMRELETWNQTLMEAFWWKSNGAGYGTAPPDLPQVRLSFPVPGGKSEFTAALLSFHRFKHALNLCFYEVWVVKKKKMQEWTLNLPDFI